MALDRDGRRSLCIGLSPGAAPIEPKSIGMMIARPVDRPADSTCCRLLALAYPALTPLQPKKASILQHQYQKVRPPNFSR